MPIRGMSKTKAIGVVDMLHPPELLSSDGDGEGCTAFLGLIAVMGSDSLPSFLPSNTAR